MKVEIALTMAGNLIVSDGDEDAPLVEINFRNQARQMTDDQKLELGRAVVESISETHGAGPVAWERPS